MSTSGAVQRSNFLNARTWSLHLEQYLMRKTQTYVLKTIKKKRFVSYRKLLFASKYCKDHTARTTDLRCQAVPSL